MTAATVRLEDAVGPEALDVVRELFAEYERAIGIDLCFQGFADELATLPGRYAPPQGRLYLARTADAVAGCVALRPLGDGVCEMKRLYVREAFRGTGVGRALARRVLEDARAIGYRRMVLDTLAGMTAARGLYASLGFRETDPYTPNPYADVRYLGIDLSGPPR